MQALITLTSAFFTAIYFVYTSRVMKKNPHLSSSLVLAMSHLVGAAALCPVWLITRQQTMVAPFTNESLVLLLVTAGFLVLSRQLYYYAYARTDVANITVFSALTPVYTLAVGYIFLKEIPSLNHLMGLLLICGSIYGLFLKTQDKTFLKSLWEPFAYIGSSLPIMCAFLSTIPTAFAATSQKKLLFSVDPITFCFFLLLSIGTMAMIMSLLALREKKVKFQISLMPRNFLFVSALLLPLIHLLFCLVMLHQQTATSLALQRFSIVFQIIFAYYFLHEHQDIRKRLVAAGFIMAGFLLIMAK